MAPKSPLLLLPFLLLAATTTTSAFNITLILNQFPELGQFNDYLSKSKVADEINSRTTITVLAVDNGSIGALSALPTDQLKSILSVHVILDYYDATKFQNLKKQSTSVTTLYQASGDADQRQGFLNMTKFADGAIVFGSTVPRSPINAKVVKSLAARPYNILVLQVSNVIVPAGLTNATIAQQPTYVAQLMKATPPPAEAPEAEAPADADAPAADAPAADAPSPAAADAPASDAPAADAPSPAAADAPAADAPSPAAADAPAADAPAADAPSPAAADAPSPAAADAPGPVADAPKGDDEKHSASGVGRVAVGAGFGVLSTVVGAVLLGM